MSATYKCSVSLQDAEGNPQFLIEQQFSVDSYRDLQLEAKAHYERHGCTDVQVTSYILDDSGYQP